MYKKVIVGLTGHRPEYTRQWLAYLENVKGIEEYVILVHSEPYDEILDMLSKTKLNIGVTVEPNKRDIAGFGICCSNMWRHGFDESDYVIACEDDVLLARDALDFLEFGRQFELDKEMLGVTCYSKVDVIPTEDLLYKFNKYGWVIWGGSMWKSRYDEVKDRWNGFDYTLWDMMKPRCVAYHPIVSRSRHIGLSKGIHVDSNTITREFYESITTRSWAGDVLTEYTQKTGWTYDWTLDHRNS